MKEFLKKFVVGLVASTLIGVGGLWIYDGVIFLKNNQWAQD